MSKFYFPKRPVHGIQPITKRGYGMDFFLCRVIVFLVMLPGVFQVESSPFLVRSFQPDISSLVGQEPMLSLHGYVFSESSFRRGRLENPDLMAEYARILLVLPKEPENQKDVTEASVLVVLTPPIQLPIQDLVGKMVDVKGSVERATPDDLHQEGIYAQLLNVAQSFGVIPDPFEMPPFLHYLKAEKISVSKGD